MPARPRELRPERSARDLFGAEMRRLRQGAGMTLETMAGIVSYSKSALARFEIAETMIPPDLPASLDIAFDTDGLFTKLYPIVCKEIHPDRYRRQMELEARARMIDQYMCQHVPGLLQTPDYARAGLRKGHPRATPEEVEEMVNARMSRQALLKADTPPEFSAILDEAVIRRAVGGPAVMRAQLAALLPLVETGTTTLQILPFSSGEHALMGGSLKLLTLDDGKAVAYEESIASGTLLEDAERVRVRRRAYDVMRANALPPRQSAAVIHQAMEALPDEQHP